MMTSGLRSPEVAVSKKVNCPQKQPNRTSKSFWPLTLVIRIRSVLRAMAPIGYEDENGFYFGERPVGQRATTAHHVDSGM
jgi:hypothetical protein